MADGDSSSETVEITKWSPNSGTGAIGSMVESSAADDRQLIRLVKERPLLYARSNLPVAKFYASSKKIWKEVADEMQWSVADVRRKWSHIRNSYSRHLRNEMLGMRTCRGRMVSRWYLADECEFLREHMATDTRNTPYSFPPSLVKHQTANLKIAPKGEKQILDVKPFLNSTWFALANIAGGSGGKGGSGGRSGSVGGGDADDSNGFTAAENCSYFQFFRSIYSDYEELPVSKQRLFKRRCLSFLHEILEDEAQETVEIQYSDHPEHSPHVVYHEDIGSEDDDDQKPVIVQTNEESS